MYIHASHSVGETVYWYDSEADSVTRGVVVELTYRKYRHGESTLYVVAVRGLETITAVGEDLYSRSESAFFNNPLWPEVQAAEPEPAEA
jgi:hypothetical protein